MRRATKKTYSRKNSNTSIQYKEELDRFDALLMSPLKQEVKFKPLNCWEKKKDDNKFQKLFKNNLSTDCVSSDSDDSFSNVKYSGKLKFKSNDTDGYKWNRILKDRSNFLDTEASTYKPENIHVKNKENDNLKVSTLINDDQFVTKRRLFQNFMSPMRNIQRESLISNKYNKTMLKDNMLNGKGSVDLNSNKVHKTSAVENNLDLQEIYKFPNILIVKDISSGTSKTQCYGSSELTYIKSQLWNEIISADSQVSCETENESNISKYSSIYVIDTLCKISENKENGESVYCNNENTNQNCNLIGSEETYIVHSKSENCFYDNIICCRPVFDDNENILNSDSSFWCPGSPYGFQINSKYNNNTILKHNQHNDGFFVSYECSVADFENSDTHIAGDYTLPNLTPELLKEKSSANDSVCVDSGFPDTLFQSIAINNDEGKLKPRNLSPNISSLSDLVSDMTISETVMKKENNKISEVSENKLLTSNGCSKSCIITSVQHSPEENSFFTSKSAYRNVTVRKHTKFGNKAPIGILDGAKGDSYIPSSPCLPAKNVCQEDLTLHYSTNFSNRRPSESSFFSTFPRSIFESTRIISESLDSQEILTTRNLEETLVSEKSIFLKPGKKWQRSISVLRCLQRDSNIHSVSKKGRHYQTFVNQVKEMQKEIESSYNSKDDYSTIFNTTVKKNNLNHTVKIKEDSNICSHLKSDIAIQNLFSIICESKYEDTSVVLDQETKGQSKLTAKEFILAECGQEEVLPFEEFFNERTLKNCKKIGEGVYGEVFMCNSNTVLKIIPVGGVEEVNGEPQKTLEEILSEVIIASKLSDLRVGKTNQTKGFSKMNRCWCVVGKYPKYLLDLWNEYDRKGKGSENDNPEIFKSDQLFIVLELENGGRDLEAFVFKSMEQSLSVLVQTAFSLAVAEKSLEFEHRDLHWGNILISSTKEKFVTVVLDNVTYKLPTKGVKSTIIDFTLSRISYEKCCIYNDLSVDETLFISKGDYQFEVYRMMQKEVNNDWSLFKPKTNIFWLHYILDKMIKMVRYKSKTNKKFLEELTNLESIVLNFDNCEDFVRNIKLKT